MDITEIIQHQHDEQRRQFAVLEEWSRDDTEGLAALWGRLAIFLELHAEAEERYFYPELVKIGSGGADAESVGEEVEDAIHDHNEIRDAVGRANAAKTGSEQWWTAVVDANVHNSNHMGEEERQDLGDFRQRASLQLRHDIAVAFLRYMAQHAADGITPKDKDPEEYVEAKEEAPPTALAKKAARQDGGVPDEPADDAPSKKSSPDLQE